MLDRNNTLKTMKANVVHSSGETGSRVDREQQLRRRK